MHPKWLQNLSAEQKVNLREVSKGLIDLAGAEGGESGPLRRRAILCRSGSWEGMYGPVEITKEKLEAIASTYNSARSQPINENDYAPLLVNHDRDADLTKGRLDVSTVQLSVDLIDGTDDEYGLFGEIRIDCEEAIKKVLKGTYAQLSISFNEETLELYEVSFVAVEAARRSIILNQGDKSVDLNLAKKKITSLTAMINQSNKSRAALSQAALGTIKTGEASLTDLIKSLGDLKSNLKTSSLKASFEGFVEEGKLTPAELKDLNLEELSELPSSALSAVLKSYSARAVSADFTQVGKGDQAPIEEKTLKGLSKASMSEAIKLQREGKSSTASLADDGEEEVDPPVAASEGEEEEESDPKPAAAFADVEKVIEQMQGYEDKLAGFEDMLKSLQETIEKLGQEEKPEGDE